MKLLRKIIFILLSVMTLCTPVIGQDNISVYINNEQQKFSASPIIENNTTLVPMRDIFSYFDYKINWDDNTKTVVASKDNYNITLSIGDKTAYINDKKYDLSTPAIIKNSKTFVPLRFIAESTGADVVWDKSKKSVIITTDFIREEPRYTIEDTVVMLTSQNAQGSGVIISPDGYIVTNYHVIQGAEGLSIMFNDSNFIYQDIHLTYLDKSRDLAIIKIDYTNLPYAIIGDSESIKSGDEVFAIGSPMSSLNVRSIGIVVEKNNNYISTTTEIDHGSSGGGLFNANNKLIGITHSYDNTRNYFSIPIEFLKTEFINPSYLSVDELKSTNSITPTGLTVNMEDDTLYINWAQVVDADYYCLYVSSSLNGPYREFINPHTGKNEWGWGFPYSIGIINPPPTDYYYKLAASSNGKLSETCNPVMLNKE